MLYWQITYSDYTIWFLSCIRDQEFHSLLLITLLVKQVQISLTDFLPFVQNLQITYKFDFGLQFLVAIRKSLFVLKNFYNTGLKFISFRRIFFGGSKPRTAYLLIVLLVTVTSLGLELSKIFCLALESWSGSSEVRRNIFNFVISLLELHCIRILWSYTQISGHKLISIRIGRALLKINVIFVQQIYILSIQILIFYFLSEHSLRGALAAINALHWSLLSTQRCIFGFLSRPFLII